MCKSMRQRGYEPHVEGHQDGARAQMGHAPMLVRLGLAWARDEPIRQARAEQGAPTRGQVRRTSFVVVGLGIDSKLEGVVKA